MNFLYPFFISFFMVFISELGDKTQLLVLSFSSKDRAKNILLGVALGTFFSRGLAILFGSHVASFSNPTFQFYLQIFSYSSFLLFGILGFIPKNKKENSSDTKFSILQKLSNFKLNCVILIAISIIIGEIGDKTFLASLNLGLQYHHYKISLILGSISGMVASNCIALFLGKFVRKMFFPSSSKYSPIEILSNILFIAFGLIRTL